MAATWRLCHQTFLKRLLVAASLVPLLVGPRVAAEKPSITAVTILGCGVARQPTLLAIDDASLPLGKNVGLYLSKPNVRAEAVLKPSPFGSGAPDDLAAHFYGTVLQDGGKFRMWYYACHWGKNPDWSPRMMQ
jgi:hypothetical protein